jgi:hypothetical protein
MKTVSRKVLHFLLGGSALLFLAFISNPALAQESNLQPETPQLKDQTGDVLANAVAGELAIIAATINSNSSRPENFVAVVEARNQIGVTELLEFQTGQISEGSVEVGISWTPTESGEYELRTFLLSDFREPNVLSEVTKTKITVKDE